MSQDAFEQQILNGLREGLYNKVVIEMEVNDNPKSLEIMPGMGAEINIGSIFGDIMPKRKKKRKITVKEAMQYVIDEESDKLIDLDAVNAEAVRRAEQEGIIFIDEIDKIAAKSKQGGVDVSREGVQRDILPIVEGSTVMTKYGPVKTDYVLFIAAGAFHISKVNDLIPELQGRFPIRVDLKSLTKEDFVNILTMPQNAITLQYKTLLLVDNIDLSFTSDAIDEIASISAELNATSEDIGARRLHSVMENLIEDISYNADGKIPLTTVKIDRNYVIEHLNGETDIRNLKKYIL
jgi:ATP-dependent HslUV protease ATP-binding subunit HslU